MIYRLTALASIMLLATAFAAQADMYCVQARLNALGHNAGPPDGLIGGKTRSAAEVFLVDSGSTLAELDKSNAKEWCTVLAGLTTGAEGLERDLPTDVQLFQFESQLFCANRHIDPVISIATIDRERKELVHTLEWFNAAISAFKFGEDQRKLIVSEFVGLADENAFTRLNWSGSGSSPAHWQQNLLKNVAIMMNLIDHFDTWEPGQRERVARWGDKIYASTHYTSWGRRQSDRWPDTIATASASYILWGAVAPNDRAYSEGVEEFKRLSKLFKESGGTRTYFENPEYLRHFPKGWGSRVEDKMIGDLVIAAHAAKAIGEDLFVYESNGVNLHDMVVGWQQTILVGELPKDEDMSFLTTNGQERSWSWTEYFVANFVDDPETKLLRDASRRIATRTSYGYQGLATGPSSCLMRVSREHP